MDTPQIVIECLKIVFSWPVAVIVILIILKKEIPGIIADLSKRLKKVEVGGQTLEFFDDLEKQSKVTEAIEKMQKDAPDLFKESLDSAGIEESEYKEFRSNIRNRVRQVQTFLNELGYDMEASGIDGVTGPRTKNAIRQFQNDYGLSPDGVIGPQTLNMMNQIRINRASKINKH